MDKNAFLDLELNDQVKYLNELCTQGKSLDDIQAEVGMDKQELGANGLYFVRDKFMGKPMRGYQTAKRSGNEVAKFDGAERLDKTKGAVL